MNQFTETYGIVLTLFYVLGPFWVSIIYPISVKRPRLVSPYLVIPASILLCGFLYLATAFWHFPLVLGMFSLFYVYALRKLDRPRAFAVSALSVFAADQLWQIPIYLNTWTTPFLIEQGLMTGAFIFMALPLLALFLPGNKKLARANFLVLFCLAALSLLETVQYQLYQNLAYLSMPLWMIFFAMIL